MKIIVCGAGHVGHSIVSYLILGNNDIIVIDDNSEKLNALAKEFDVQPVLGKASHPKVLEKAGAENADMLIAVTDDDEVNIVACEVASILFNVTKKIARVDNQDFLNPLWSGLFSEKHIPIDLVISPAAEIAKATYALLKMPKMSMAVQMLHYQTYVLGFRYHADQGLQNLNIRQMEHLVPDAGLKVFCIIHEGVSFIPAEDYVLRHNDMVYFICSSSSADAIIKELGLETSPIENLVIFGGNNVSQYLAADLEKDDSILNTRIIENSPEKAYYLAKKLQNTAVIQGDLFSEVILEEAGLETCDATLAVLPQDKDNLLISLISRQHHVPLTLSLVNAASYNNLLENLSDNVLIDGSAVIISSMLQEFRKARLRNAYSLGYNLGEIWEISLGDDNLVIGQKISQTELPVSACICAIYRAGKVIFPDDKTVFEAQDDIVLYVGTKGIKKVEKLFA